MRAAGLLCVVVALVITGCAAPESALPTREKFRVGTVGGVRAGNTYYFSGIDGRDQVTKEYPASVGDRTRNIMQRFQEGLSELGMDWNNVPKANVYITDIQNKPQMNEAYYSFFEGYDSPARVCVEAGLEGEALVEIAIIAVRTAN